MAKPEPADPVAPGPGWRVTRSWKDAAGHWLAETDDFSDMREAYARYHAQCKWSGDVDLYDVARREVIASNSWPDGWKPGVLHEQRRFTTDG